MVGVEINDNYYEEMQIVTLDPDAFDFLLAHGWRHWGNKFYRYSQAPHNGERVIVLPLRVDLTQFMFSKSQRRNLRKNSDLSLAIRDTELTDEVCELYKQHKEKFLGDTFETVHSIFSEHPADEPCSNKTILVYEKDKLIAASFIDLAATGGSAVYGMYDLNEAKRGLGVFTLLLELLFVQQLGMRYHYLGYSYNTPSHYDYKKKFSGTEAFTWEKWIPLEEA